MLHAPRAGGVGNGYHRRVQTPLPVSESGISDPETVVRLREAGFRGFLMGEAFMKSGDPGGALAEFIARLKEARP